MEERDGILLAISVDETDVSKRLVEELELPFAILSAAGIPVLEDYGVEHEGGGLDGETIAVPTQLLIERSGAVVWRHTATRITDRVRPQETLAAIARLNDSPPPR